MGASPSSKKYSADSSASGSPPKGGPPPKVNKKYKTPSKAITVSSARLGAAVYEDLYEESSPAEVLGRGRQGEILGGTAQAGIKMMIVRIDHRRSARGIGTDRDRAALPPEAPGLGVVPIRGQRGIAHQLLIG